MTNPKVNYFIDVLAAASFVAIAITSWQIFTRTATRNVLQMHIYAGWILVIIAAIHLILHLGWIKAMTKSFFN